MKLDRRTLMRHFIFYSLLFVLMVSCVCIINRVIQMMGLEHATFILLVIGFPLVSLIALVGDTIYDRVVW